MITRLSQTTAATIVASLPLIESRRDSLEAEMSRYIAAARGLPLARAQAASAAILDMLLDHAGRVSPAGEIVRIERHGARQRRLAIGGADYSAFGDGFGAIMKDVLGAEATPARRAAWGDFYWAIRRLIAAAPVALAA